MRTTVLLGGIAGLFWTASTNAATITQNITFAPLVDFQSESAPPVSYFDPTLGTLTSVAVFFNLTATFVGGGSNAVNEIDYNIFFGGFTTAFGVFSTGDGVVDRDISFTVPSFGLASYSRAGSFTPTITSFNGGTNARVVTTFSPTNRIVYTFTAATVAVPEPATWAMMALGFGLVGAAARKRPTLAAA